MNVNTVDKIFAIATLLLGTYIAATAPSYGYMDDGVPGSGFFPIWIGLIIMGLSIANFVRSLRGKEHLTDEFDKTSVLKSIGIAVAVLVFIVTIDIAGIMLGSAVLILVLGAIIHSKWDARLAAKLVAIAIIFPIASHYLFGVYLNVPLPKGSLGI